jgi:hypothetical protein
MGGRRQAVGRPCLWIEGTRRDSWRQHVRMLGRLGGIWRKGEGWRRCGASLGCAAVPCFSVIHNLASLSLLCVCVCFHHRPQATDMCM